MNSVYFPAHVVLILRRIVNVISTLSISNQYLLKYANADEQSTRADSPAKLSPFLKQSPLSTRRDVDVEWPSWSYKRGWEWPPFGLRENRGNFLDSLIDPALISIYSAQISLLERNLSTSAQLDTQSQADQLPDFHEDPHPPEALQLPSPCEPELEPKPNSLDIIHQLILNPALSNPLRTPRYPIILCHGNKKRAERSNTLWLIKVLRIRAVRLRFQRSTEIPQHAHALLV